MQKNIVITGTSRGIGYQMVGLLADTEHRVLALSRDEVPISGLGLTNCDCFPCDITQEDDLKRVAKHIEQNWGRVDILIHNSGNLVNKPFSKLTPDEVLKCYQVNVFGVMRLTQYLLPFMDKQSHVVGISSMGGVMGSAKFPGLAAYSSSKGALNTLIEVLAEEYKENGPSFNALALGAVQTEMLQEAFPGYEAPITAKEMAGFVVEFALNGNRFYNGKILPVSSTTP